MNRQLLKSALVFKLRDIYYQLTDTDTADQGEQRRGRIMAIYLLLSFMMLLNILFSNLAALWMKSGPEYEVYLLEDLATLGLMIGLWQLNRKGHIKVAAHISITLSILGAVILYNPNNTEFNIEILILPIITSSFVISPPASFYYALFATSGYTYYSYYYDALASYNFTGVLAIFATAFFTFFTAWQLNNTLNKNQSLLKDLQSSYEVTLDSWSRALDLRDKETEGHTQRVTKLTCKVARAMKLSEEELVHIRRGALLHDIGKLGVPDEILHKNGPLTDTELKIMRQHPQFAYNLLYPIEYLRPSMDIPYCHHEKWDGSGYPRGLKGKEIPLSARIFAVADVYDALTSNRPYRQAWSQEKTLDYIQKESGTHFDPDIVKIFVEEIPNL